MRIITPLTSFSTRYALHSISCHHHHPELEDGDEAHSGKPGDMERHGAAGVAVRLRRRIRVRHDHRVRLLQLQRLLVRTTCFHCLVIAENIFQLRFGSSKVFVLASLGQFFSCFRTGVILEIDGPFVFIASVLSLHLHSICVWTIYQSCSFLGKVS